MTDRIHSFTVVLDHDTRADDALSTENAIGMIKGVISVTPNVTDADSHYAAIRADTSVAVMLSEAMVAIRKCGSERVAKALAELSRNEPKS